VVYALLFIAIAAMVVYSLSQNTTASGVLTINQLASEVQNNKVARIVTDENKLTVTYKDGTQKTATSTKDTGATLVEQLTALGVTPAQLSSENIQIEIKPPSQWLGLLSGLAYILPIVLVIGAFFFIFRQAQGSNNAAMSFGKSRARMFTGDQPTVTFADVAGVEESKEELKEVVEKMRE
jgi:cell division protease FtsH